MPSQLSNFSGYTEESWTVPVYVDVIRIIAAGAAGGDAETETITGDVLVDGGSGGNGGEVQGDLSVTPGESLYVVAGSQGEGSENGSSGGQPNGGDGGTTGDHANGGGGGGSSDVRQGGTAVGDIVIGAGGGGGSGQADASQQMDSSDGAGGGGAGADAADVSVDGITYPGGDGGASGGYQGGDGTAGSDSDGDSGAGGGGGGGINGGSGGEGDQAENSGSTSDHGYGAGGGGGDGSVAGVTNVTETVGANSGDGYVDIKYSDRITDLSVDVVNDGSIEFSWTAPLDANSITIYRAESSGASPSDYATVDSGLDPSKESHVDDNLENGETYYYRIENVNSFDNRLSNEIFDTTSIPAPSNLSGSFNGAEVVLTWQNNDNSPDGSISVQRSYDGGSTWTTIASGLGTNDQSYTDTTVQAGVTATYRIIRDTNDATTTSPTEEVIVAGSIVIGNNGVRTTNNGVVNTTN